MQAPRIPARLKNAAKKHADKRAARQQARDTKRNPVNA